jgi:arylsulfatase A-like enzyme
MLPLMNLRRESSRIAIAAIVAGLGTASGLAAAEAAPARPNIVFILADDLGWSDTTLNRPNAFYETPNLDRLAQRGVRFMQAYSANPLCSPTRASVLTGLYPARIGITAPVCHLPEEVLLKALANQASPAQKAIPATSVTRLQTNYWTLAKALKQAGYATGHFGKWHLGPEPYSPLQQGFDVDVPHWPGPGPAGSYIAPWKSPKFTLAAQPGEHVEDLMAAQAIQFIRAHKDQPFFLNYWAFSVHAPIDGKKELIEKYRLKAAKLPADSPQRHPIYAAMVQSLDQNVGRLMRALDELKLTERTIIVFLSDNGGVHWTARREHDAQDASRDIPITSNTPLRGGKATTYEGGTREPCVVIWPGITKPGSVSDSVIQSTDFAPTFVELLRLPVPSGPSFDGKSFASALRGQAFDRGPTFCHFPHNTPTSGGLASTYVRVGDWKLIRFYCLNDDGSDRLELYNLRDDLSEAHNLAAQHPQKVTELNALIAGFLKNTEAVVPVINPRYDPNAKTPPAAPRPKGKGKGKRPTALRDPRLKLEAGSEADVYE